MERAEWLLLMDVKCKLLAMAGGSTRALAQALFPEVLFPNFSSSTVYAAPRDVGRSELSKSGCGKSHQIDNALVLTGLATFQVVGYTRKQSPT
jgi:hypothetical protein